MTFENAKKLYQHYKTIGNTAAVTEILNKYPQLKEEVKETKPKEVKEVKDEKDKKSKKTKE